MLDFVNDVSVLDNGILIIFFMAIENYHTEDFIGRLIS